MITDRKAKVRLLWRFLLAFGCWAVISAPSVLVTMVYCRESAGSGDQAVIALGLAAALAGSVEWAIRRQRPNWWLPALNGIVSALVLLYGIGIVGQ